MVNEGLRSERLARGYWFFSLAYMLSCFSHVRLFMTLWTVAHQALLSMGFLRQEYWSGLSCPLPEDLPNQALQVDSLPLSHWGNWFFSHCLSKLSQLLPSTCPFPCFTVPPLQSLPNSLCFSFCHEKWQREIVSKVFLCFPIFLPNFYLTFSCEVQGINVQKTEQAVLRSLPSKPPPLDTPQIKQTHHSFWKLVMV